MYLCFMDQRSQSNDTVTISRQEYNNLLSTVDQLKTELDKVRRMLFSTSSERFISTVDPNQTALGLEGADNKAPEVEYEDIAYKRKKRDQEKEGHSRVELPDNLPREEIIIEPDHDVTGWKRIGQEETRILCRRRGSFFVRVFIRPKYAAPQGEGVVIGKLPLLPIHKGNADASVIACIIAGKFIDHLPWYRQSQMFKREGLSIAESTMIGWVRAACQLMEPLYEEQKKALLKSTYLQVDETPIPVLSQDTPGSAHKGYFWVYFDPITKTIVIEYRQGRGREGPITFLKEFRGILQTDGYSVYDIFERTEGVTLVGCMAHARRKFDEAKYNDKERAEQMLMMIQELYAIERRIQDQDFDTIRAVRQQEALPILSEMHSWLKAQLLETLPKSTIGQAIAYTLNLWSRLIRYTEDGRLRIDNNLIENSIRPIAIGRKNYLFAGSHDAAQRSAMIYSFVGTCRKLQIDPQVWFEDVLGRLPYFKKNDDLNILLPANWKPAS